ncbi:MAG: YVTN family beta-propeller repeat protein [Gemmatimonadaceae bacterium]
MTQPTLSRPRRRAGAPLRRTTRAAAAVVLLGCASSGGRAAPTVPGLLLVLNKGAATASLIDPASGETRATMATGQGPHEVALSPDGRTAVVTNYGVPDGPGSTLTVLDLATRRATATIDLAPHQRPHGVAWLPDGRLVAVTLETDSLVALVDVAAGRIEATIPTGQALSHMIRVSADGAYAYVANIGSGSVTMMDLAGRYVLRTVPTGAGAEGIALTPDGAELWVTNRAANTVSVLDAQTMAPLDTLPSSDFPIRVAFTPDGSTALVTNARSGDLRFFDVATGDSMGVIAMRADSTLTRGTMLGMAFGAGTGVPIGVIVSPDGRLAYVSNANVDAVTVVDVRERRVTGYLPTGREPDGVVFVPGR